MRFLIMCLMMSSIITSTMDNPIKELSLTQKVDNKYNSYNYGQYFDKEKIQQACDKDPSTHLFYHAITHINEQVKENETLKKIISDPIGCRAFIKYIAQHFDRDEGCVAGSMAEFGFESARKIWNSQNKFYRKFFLFGFDPEIGLDLTEVDLEFTYFLDGTPLMKAAKDGCIEQMDWLLKHGANINQTNGGNTDVLRHACLPAMEFLVSQKNIIIDQRDTQGRTALLYLLKLCTFPHGYLWEERGSNLLQVEGRVTDKIETLLNAGANPEICDNEGVSPIKMAIQIKEKWECSAGDKILQLIQNAISFKKFYWI